MPQASVIVRMWRGREKRDRPGAYRRHLEGAVFPHLRSLPGFLGASLLQRVEKGEAEVLVMTKWDSMAAIEAFAGPDPEKALVEPEARAVLASFDEVVTHHEIVSKIGTGGLSDRAAVKA
ncbi:MAG: antibiotic biosynthesis monooxygenase [Hyphomicrobiales bacterium]|nr:antibiotic biosynthesis monooxygenase [Hyphomicrobiales bacterium]